MTIYERIKKRRKELNISAEELAKALNVSRATIYRYESSDIEKLPTTILEPLSKILQTTPAYLMGWEEPPGSIKTESDKTNYYYSNNFSEYDGYLAEENQSNYYINDDTREMIRDMHDNKNLKILFDASRKLSTDDLAAVIDIVNRLKGKE